MFGRTQRRDAKLDEAARALEAVNAVLARSRAMMEKAESTIKVQSARIRMLERIHEAMRQQWHETAAQWQSAIRDAQTQNVEDARLIVAYRRWCEENDCVPSSADLERLGQ